MSEQYTVDEYEIKAWIEANGGKPAIRHIDGEEFLHVSFGRENPHPPTFITWEDFFDKFERDNLAFVYEAGYTGEEQHVLNDVCEFVDRDSVQVSLGSEESALYADGDEDLMQD